MKKTLPEIYKHSQNLFNVLNYTFKSALNSEIDHVFKKCLEQGGKLELDFQRPEDQSYNPRPARIALILINDSKQKELSIIKSAMLASINDSEDPDAKGANEICTLKNINQSFSREAKIIALALQLDRARHFHLSTEYKTQRANFHDLTKKILDLAGPECERVSQLLAHWLKRDEQRN